MPRARHSRAMSATGKMRAVGLVTWSITTSRVRGVNADTMHCVTSAGSRMGSGSGSSMYVAPVWRARKSMVLRTAL